MKEADYTTNLDRLEATIKFSQDANRGLKADYDSLQVKFDKHMKATNNLNMDLKDEISQQ